MPNMNHKGPEGKGPRTGRGLGGCKNNLSTSTETKGFELGKGMGLRRNSGGGNGKGKRLRYDENKR